MKTYVVTCSSEPSHRDGSDEGSHHMVLMRNKKTYSSIMIKYSLLSRAQLMVSKIFSETYQYAFV